ncbi:hypothetical protein [Agrococcus sp. Marseille-Q4369]|uniref:hypothetical protein n=1 Tax=Agrococcus sp. Marseille-Q4369 TaxID=2810513 RepID=UPI001B8C41A4|nr:hypothetical protein [Agrococcus sp. Marseille-Q4369]QUW18893.1 hypothetical protein JSQ78_00465 [Agrococcus sp. Marseille-Q4369]
MPIMRDKHSKVVRDVPQVTLDRWPDEYEPAPKTIREQVEATGRPHAPAPRPKRRSRETKTPAAANQPTPTVPAEGTDTKGEVA